VNFKHAGNRPDIDDCREFRQDLLSFVRVTLPSFLGLDYDGVSLVQLVAHTRTRNHLRTAEGKLAEGLFGESAAASTVAFCALSESHRTSPSRSQGRGSFGRIVDEMSRPPVTPLSASASYSSQYSKCRRAQCPIVFGSLGSLRPVSFPW
jgi:hypothetical protein